MRRHLAPLALLAGLASGSPAATAADTIRVAVLPYLSQAPLFVALEEGLFEQEGITIERVDVTTDQAVLSGIMAGDIDLANALPSPGLFNAIARGGAARIVGPGVTLSTASCSYAVFYGRKGIDRAALTSGGARRLKVSVGPLGFDHFMGDRIEALPGAEGLELEASDVPAPAEGEALAAGTIDLAATSEPWPTRFDAAGVGQVAIGNEAILPDAQWTTLLFSARLLQDEPELGARVARAMSAAIARYNEGKTARNLEILAKHTRLDPDFLSRACWPYYPDDGVVRTDTLMAYQDWLLANGGIDRVIPPEELVAEVGTP